MKIFTLSFTEPQLAYIGDLLGNAPFRAAAPIIQAINQQVARQNAPKKEGKIAEPRVRAATKRNRPDSVDLPK